ncbi:hypothetical protein WT27_28860 [Burkholderia territorii]|uniref:Uncharacterized protein n=2 Tax=Burkholderia territorii TaxID=1503055 RepID=A0A105VRH3_9BURK|nr:hypothetical protein WT27_28860 [Burkholderia territorii]KVX41334.1 hypothetical protein WT31_29735 [Burkholderia territorii]
MRIGPRLAIGSAAMLLLALALHTREAADSRPAVQSVMNAAGAVFVAGPSQRPVVRFVDCLPQWCVVDVALAPGLDSSLYLVKLTDQKQFVSMRRVYTYGDATRKARFVGTHPTRLYVLSVTRNGEWVHELLNLGDGSLTRLLALRTLRRHRVIRQEGDQRALDAVLEYLARRAARWV